MNKELKKRDQGINTGVVFSEVLILVAIVLTIINILVSSNQLSLDQTDTLVQVLEERTEECKQLVEELNVKVTNECPEINLNDFEKIENNIVIVKEEPEKESAQELPSPLDRINIAEIGIQQGRFYVPMTNTEKLFITNTNSMDPVIDEESTIIIKKVNFPNQIQIGDIIAYNSNSTTIVHRIIGIEIQNNTAYYQTKGDNNQMPDKKLVPFNAIKGVVVAIIY